MSSGLALLEWFGTGTTEVTVPMLSMVCSVDSFADLAASDRIIWFHVQQEIHHQIWSGKMNAISCREVVKGAVGNR
jgi:hypothetical protein